ncbi:Fur-regulated basic protein FbpA [Halobacillus fulvus]|nr:Fur-regulated basic protein FbpA [Halobacillus fulvus]
MKNYLRNAVETMRSHYIQRLIKSGHYHSSDPILHTMTLSELERLVHRLNRR